MMNADNFIVLLFLWGSSANAETSVLNLNGSERKNDELTKDTIYVLGSKEKVFTSPGSATFINAKEIKEQEATDIGRILDKVPGVYIQEEDGLGLRPNIGLRGAHPHRSKKVTLLEDGILIGPAPYSSPAAYYFPSTTLSHNLEVFKGASSVKYGPNSIGGAVNLITRPIAEKETTRIDVSGGLIQKAMVSHSGKNERSGWLIEMHRLQTDGFMELPNGKDTGTEKNDFLMKLEERLQTDVPQKVSLKAGYSTEKSHETYLGLSQNDFNLNPRKRYAASSDDMIEWAHYQVQLKHDLQLSDYQNLSTTFYHHGFDRRWFKFNGFKDKRDLRSLLNDSSDSRSIGILNGTVSSINPDDRLILGNNDRRYLSQGAQAEYTRLIEGEGLSHDVSLGLRFHRDYVKRNHTEIDAILENTNLKYDPSSEVVTNLTHDEARASTLFLNDEMSFEKLTLSGGLRFENVRYITSSLLTPEHVIETDENVLVPGLGANFLITPDWAIFSSINRGVTLVGPGQSPDEKEEQSINLEAGIRLKNQVAHFETIGFLSEYSNIKGTCSFSSGCTGDNLDKSYDGGRARIVGLETQLGTSLFNKEWEFPLGFGYTRTVAKFKKDNESTNEEWGIGKIRKGDPLPYVPQDQWNLKAGARYKKIASNVQLLWKGKMADQSVREGRKIIPGYGIIDWSTSYAYSQNGKGYVKVDNLLDKTYMTSLRPFGYRSGKPRTYSVGLEHTF